MKLYDILKEELESDQEEQSQFPLSDYFEENYAVDDEKLFLQLASELPTAQGCGLPECFIQEL